MPYCRIHGEEYESWQGCSACRAAEETAAEEREELREEFRRQREEREAAEEREEEARRESEYRSANPGDYECPWCLFTTLRRGARRCPTCHGVVPDEYWPPIFETEERERQRRAREAEEWARTAPERQRKAEEDAKARRSARFASNVANTLGTLAGICAFFVAVIVLFGIPVGEVSGIAGEVPIMILLGVQLQNSESVLENLMFLPLGVFGIAAPIALGIIAGRTTARWLVK